MGAAYSLSKYVYIIKPSTTVSHHQWHSYNTMKVAGHYIAAFMTLISKQLRRGLLSVITLWFVHKQMSLFRIMPRSVVQCFTRERMSRGTSRRTRRVIMHHVIYTWLVNRYIKETVDEWRAHELARPIKYKFYILPSIIAIKWYNK